MDRGSNAMRPPLTNYRDSETSGLELAFRDLPRFFGVSGPSTIWTGDEPRSAKAHGSGVPRTSPKTAFSEVVPDCLGSTVLSPARWITRRRRHSRRD